VVRVAADGVALAVHEWPGQGRAPKTIIGIHGLTANHRCWARMAEVVAPDHRLVAYDLRGRGDSAKPATGHGLAVHGRDLAALLDHFGLHSAVLMGHSLGAAIALRFAVDHPRRVRQLVLIDGGLDVRAEVLDSLAPAIARLGMEFPSLDAFLERMRGLPMFAGRWNDALEDYFRYDVETLPSGVVRSKAAPAAIQEELRSLQRERLWTLHHRVRCPTLILRAPDGLLTASDCLMTREEGQAMAAAIPRAKLVEIPHTNHYTVLMGRHPRVRAVVRAFLRGR
jgi:pimeloyl-ACP methyl ester carboxylesterase